jgi:thiol-disulfide isomerase/thioredoxin
VQFSSKYFLNIENNIYPSHFYTLFANIPTFYNLGFSKKKFTRPKINKLSGDSLLVIQRYKKNQKIRILSIDENLKIFKIQIVNPDTTSPDEYWQYNIYYLNNINLDSFKKSNTIGKFSKVASHKNDSLKNTQIKKIKINTEIPIIGHENLVLDTNNNKLLLLDYWYFGCAPCMKMMPFIHQLEKNIDTSKLNIIGINAFDKPTDITYYLEKKGYNSKQMNCNVSAPLHQIVEHPTLILVDYKLNIINRWVGYSPSTCSDIESTLKILGLIKQ